MTHTVDEDIGLDKEVFAGEDKILRWQIRKADDTPQDLTAWSGKLQIRLTKYTPDPAIMEWSMAIFGAAANGQWQAVIASADTLGLKAGTYWYGVMRTNPGSIDIVATGEFVLRKGAVTP